MQTNLIKLFKYLQNSFRLILKSCPVHVSYYLRNHLCILYRFCRNIVLFLAFYFETSLRYKVSLSCSSICLYLVLNHEKIILNTAQNLCTLFYLFHEVFLRKLILSIKLRLVVLLLKYFMSFSLEIPLAFDYKSSNIYQ